jgi:hypothetical protein
VRRRAKAEDAWPLHLREFREADWPPTEGECLGHYGCRGLGYEVACVPRIGEACGQRSYEMLARDYPDRPEVEAAARSADAYERFHQARLAWLGKDHPRYLDEFIDGHNPYSKIRYAPFRSV